MEGITLAGTAALAATVQIQQTIDFGGIPVRVSLSDILALVLLPLLATICITRWRNSGWRIGPLLPLLVAFATVTIGYGLAFGAMRLGSLEAWPLVKAVGWLSLLYYGVLGVVFALLLPRLVNTMFTRTFLGVAAGLLFIHTIFFATARDWIGSYGYRYQGILDNPNAQGFVLLCAFAICLAGQSQLKDWLGNRWSEIGTCFILAGVVHSSSLAAVGAALIVALLHLMVRTENLWCIIRITVFAGAILAISVMCRYAMVDSQIRTGFHDLFDKIGWLASPQETERDYSLGSDLLNESLKAQDSSIKVRLESYEAAVREWAKSPIFGRGLGSHLIKNQVDGTGSPGSQIHNTGLWILTEMGIVGLAVFVGLFSALFRRFWKTYKNCLENDEPAAEVIYAGILCMVGWFVMSLAHELLYQRVLWLIMGISLGTCIWREQQSRQSVAARDVLGLQ